MEWHPLNLKSGPLGSQCPLIVPALRYRMEPTQINILRVVLILPRNYLLILAYPRTFRRSLIVNFPHEDLLRPMINMTSGIKPNYGVYLIHIVLGQEGLDTIHLLTYHCSCLRGRTTV